MELQGARHVLLLRRLGAEASLPQGPLLPVYEHREACLKRFSYDHSQRTQKVTSGYIFFQPIFLSSDSRSDMN